MAEINQQDDPLLQKLDQLRGRFDRYKQKVKENRAYYNLDFKEKVVPPDERDSIEPLMPPTARRAIDEAIDHILHTPRVRIPVRPTERNTEEEQDIAERKRRFADAWWRNINRVHNPIGDGRKPLINEGRLCLRKALRWDLLPEHPGPDASRGEKKRYRRAIESLGKTDFIWELEVLDNNTVYEDPSNHRDPRYVFVEYEILVEDAKETFPNTDASWTELGDYEKVNYVEYWSVSTGDTPGRYIQWVSNDRVHDGENPYPYIPIAIEDSGYGTISPTSDIEDKYVGLTQYTQDIFNAEARQMTSMQAVTEITAFPMLTSRNMDEGKNIEVGPGAINRLEGSEDDPAREQLEILQWPEIPLSVLQLIQRTQDLANGALKMDTLGGQPLPGVETATEADQQIRNASAKLGSPVAALERLIQKITRWVFIDVEKVLEAPVTVFSATGPVAEVRIQPSEINGYYENLAELRTTDEEALNMNKARFWSELTRVLPFLSYTTAMEKGEIADDPRQEMVKRASEDAFLSDEMRQVRTLTAARSLGELASLLQALQTDTTLPGVTPTGGPNSAETLVPTERSPVLAQAQMERDLNQGAAQLRAGTNVPA